MLACCFDCLTLNSTLPPPGTLCNIYQTTFACFCLPSELLRTNSTWLCIGATANIQLKVKQELSRDGLIRSLNTTRERKVTSTGRMSSHRSPVLCSSWPHLSDNSSQVVVLVNADTHKGLYSYQTSPFCNWSSGRLGAFVWSSK